jgi:pantoate--beta-alanine ligase
MSQPTIVNTIAELRALTAGWRKAGETIGLVPTMGALHEGHISLTRLIHQKTKRTVVSIFVNPTQFGPNEDFTRYPRTFEADCQKLAAAGVDAVFAPAPDEVYPDGFCTTISLNGPATAGLEDAFRPTHFAGVATVVAKLFTMVAPDAAIFGEKDFQQLAVIRRMARDLNLPVDILGAPTMREADDLAMSSRNVYLSPAERQAAPALNRAMRTAAAAIRGGAGISTALDEARAAIAAAGFVIDYLEVRDAGSLAPVEKPDGRALRMLAAARLGKTRLIDNISLED